MAARRGHLWMSILALLLGACNVLPVVPTPTPTVTPRPSATPTPTVTPTPTPSPTATPSVDDFTLQITPNIEGGQLPADEYTEISVGVHLEVPSNRLFDPSTVLVFLRADGGGEFVDSPIRLDADGQGTGIYRTGESTGVSTVQLVASLDLPQLGRIQATTTLQLVRQEVKIRPRQLFVAVEPSAQVEIIFDVQISPDDLNGQYRFVASLDESKGRLTSAPATATEQTPLVTIAGAGELRYTYQAPPLGDEQTSDSEQVCLVVSDRLSIPENGTCVTVLWGNIAAELDSRFEERVYWNREAIVDFRLQALSTQNQALATAAGVCYQVVASQLVTTSHLRDWRTGDSFVSGNCEQVVLNIGGVTYVGYQPHRAAWVSEWTLQAPGTPRLSPEIIVAAQPYGVAQPTQPVMLTVGGGTLTLILDAAASSFVLFGDQPFAPERPQQLVLVRLLVPADRLNADGQFNTDISGQDVPIVTSVDALHQSDNVMGRLQWDDTPPILAGVSSQSYTSSVEEQKSKKWRFVYLYAQVVNAQIYVLQ